MKFQTISLKYFFCERHDLLCSHNNDDLFTCENKHKEIIFSRKSSPGISSVFIYNKYIYFLPSLHTAPQDKKANQDPSLDISHQHKTVKKLFISRSFFQAVL